MSGAKPIMSRKANIFDVNHYSKRRDTAPSCPDASQSEATSVMSLKLYWKGDKDLDKTQNTNQNTFYYNSKHSVWTLKLHNKGINMIFIDGHCDNKEISPDPDLLTWEQWSLVDKKEENNKKSFHSWLNLYFLLFRGYPSEVKSQQAFVHHFFLSNVVQRFKVPFFQ